MGTVNRGHVHSTGQITNTETYVSFLSLHVGQRTDIN